MRHSLRTLIVIGIALAGTGMPATAGAQDFSCVVADAAGDLNGAPGRGFDGASYQDILETRIERSGDTIVLSMDVAAAVPAAPELKTPHGLLLWMWGMNTHPGVPKGYPLGSGVAGLLDFWIHVAWDGDAFEAVVIDRRPGATGGTPIVTSVPFVIEGTSLAVAVPAALLGEPQAFTWGSSTWIWPTHLGTTGAHRVDEAPDVGGSPCPGA